jgi:hypothetical protein
MLVTRLLISWQHAFLEKDSLQLPRIQQSCCIRACACCPAPHKLQWGAGFVALVLWHESACSGRYKRHLCVAAVCSCMGVAAQLSCKSWQLR